MDKLRKYAGLLNDAAPQGEFLAFINEDEAKMLEDAGGSGLLTRFGIPSYRVGGQAGREYGGGGGSRSSGSSGGGNRSGGGGADRDNRQQYSARQYTAPKPKPKPIPDRGRGQTPKPTPKPKPKVTKPEPKVDVGFQEALRKQKIRQQDPVFGDPDPQIDAPIEERDTITSFLDNYAANIASNPLEIGLIGALKTAYQTKQARSMLEGTPGYEFLRDGSVVQSEQARLAGGGADQDRSQALTNIISQVPYAISGTTHQQSMVNQYFANLGMSGQSPLSSKLETDYNTAKQSINSLLGIVPPSQQFGYSSDPYGGLMATNLATNPFNIPYLQQRGLI